MKIIDEYFKGIQWKKLSRKERSFQVWIEKLITIASSIFHYENLPANLPQWELESRLLIDGRAVVFKDKVYGIVTSFGYTSGVDIYNHANEFGYAQPVLKSRSGLKNLIDGVIVYSTSIDKTRNNGGTVGRRITYYADLLSDIDVSKQLLLIGGRSTQSVIAKNDNAFRELKKFIDGLIQGDLTVPKIESGVLDSVESIFKDIRQQGVYTLVDLDLAQQNLLKMFYTDFGIPYGYEKSERLVIPEIAANNAMVDINVHDMLKCRRAGIEAINNLYGTAITVELENNYDII